MRIGRIRPRSLGRPHPTETEMAEDKIKGNQTLAARLGQLDKRVEEIDALVATPEVASNLICSTRKITSPERGV